MSQLENKYKTKELVVNNAKVLERIRESVKPAYCCEKFYTLTIWTHALAVAQFAKEFSAQMGADEFVAETAGLLHDLGAALLGKEDHHRTGVEKSSVVLFEAKCAPEYMWPIFSAIYTHRGSQKIPFMNREGICVAAGDAKDHFENIGELWLAQQNYLRTSNPVHLFQVISDKLVNDWGKISPEIRIFLRGSLSNAILELREFLKGKKAPAPRSQLVS